MTSKEDGKPDVNDVPMEETEVRSKYLLFRLVYALYFTLLTLLVFDVTIYIL